MTTAAAAPTCPLGSWAGSGRNNRHGSAVAAAVSMLGGRHPLQPGTPPAAAAVSCGLVGSVSGVDSEAGLGQQLVGGGMPMRVPLGQHQELVISLVSI